MGTCRLTEVGRTVSLPPQGEESHVRIQDLCGHKCQDHLPMDPVSQAICVTFLLNCPKSLAKLVGKGLPLPNPTYKYWKSDYLVK